MKATISRGTAGDCCVACGRVGVDLPQDHDCQPDVAVDTQDNVADFYELFTKSISTATTASASSLAAHGSPRSRLLGLLRTVERASIGQRNSTLFWASCRVGEMVVAGEIVDVNAAAQALTQAAGAAGLRGPEVLGTINSGLDRAGVA